VVAQDVADSERLKIFTPTQRLCKVARENAVKCEVGDVVSWEGEACWGKPTHGEVGKGRISLKCGCG